MNTQLSTTIVTAASPTFNPMMKATMKLCLITPMLALNQSKLTLTNTIHPIMAIAPNLNNPPQHSLKPWILQLDHHLLKLVVNGSITLMMKMMKMTQTLAWPTFSQQGPKNS